METKKIDLVDGYLKQGKYPIFDLCLASIRERMWKIQGPCDCWARELFCS